MIEAIYSANHEQNLPLSNWNVLLACAEKAGVTEAEALLQSDQEVQEVRGKIKKHIDMGINSVPVLIFNEKYRVDGAPDAALLQEVFARLLEECPTGASL